MMPQGWQWIILLLIVLLLFGATRLPKLARSLGESARIFKSEVKTTQQDGEQSDDDASAEPPAVEGRVIDVETDAHKSRGHRDHS